VSFGVSGVWAKALAVRIAKVKARIRIADFKMRLLFSVGGSRLKWHAAERPLSPTYPTCAGY
jgi:hypothetical protein